MKGTLRVAVASGKGGTGKTTIATCLAVVLAETGIPTAYVDCDVEEPNGHLFLRPAIRSRRDVSIPVPQVDKTRCTLCGACGEACRYSAIVALPKDVVTFPKLCHGCGGCTQACTERAIREVPRVTGTVEQGIAGEVTFLHGKLIVGEAMAPPVVRAVLANVPRDHVAVIDAPPGTSCPVIESVKGSDVVLLVTEPTPFGLNDLRLAVEMVRELGLPFGVIINRAGSGDLGVAEYCAQEHIPVLLVVGNERAIARAYSRGELAITAMPELKPLFLSLYDQLCELARMSVARSAPRPATVYADASAPDRPPSELVWLGRNNGLRELVVVSGKGGTGKTSIVASFLALTERGAAADCDVDAADLHLVLAPTVRQRRPFSGGSTAVIDSTLCTVCGACVERCRFDAIQAPGTRAGGRYNVNPIACEGCGVCVDVCPPQAIALVRTTSGEWLISDTRRGPMVHARLGIAQANSGKLVTLVRREAKAVARDCEILVCDGSPGIGCPVIASISGARMVLVVTEPTVSGLHDFKRIADLCRQLQVKTAVCINKADINPEVVSAIEAEACQRSIPVLGTIRYDDSVTAAQVKQLTVVEHDGGPAATDIRALWTRVQASMREA